MPSWRCTLASGPGWARRQASRFVQRRGAALQVQNPSCFKLKGILRRFWRERMQAWRLRCLWWCTRKLSEWRESFCRTCEDVERLTRAWRGKGVRSGRALKTAATDPWAYNWKQGEHLRTIFSLGIWSQALGLCKSNRLNGK